MGVGSPWKSLVLIICAASTVKGGRVDANIILSGSASGGVAAVATCEEMLGSGAVSLNELADVLTSEINEVENLLAGLELQAPVTCSELFDALHKTGELLLDVKVPMASGLACLDSTCKSVVDIHRHAGSAPKDVRHTLNEKNEQHESPKESGPEIQSPQSLSRLMLNLFFELLPAPASDAEAHTGSFLQGGNTSMSPGMPRTVTLSGFPNQVNGFQRDFLNGIYIERAVGAKQSSLFWKADGKYFLYHCKKYNDWRVAELNDLTKCKAGECIAYAKTATGVNILNPSLAQFSSIWNGNDWQSLANAGVIALNAMNTAFGQYFPEEKRQHMQEAVQRAVLMGSQAVRATLRQSHDSALNYYFGGSSTSHRRTVRTVLNDAIAVLNNAKLRLPKTDTHWWGRPGAKHGCNNPDTTAYVYSEANKNIGSHVKQEGQEPYLASLLLHEATHHSHRIGYVADHAYCGFDRSRCQDLAANDAQKAMHNADSYRWFAEAVSE